MWSPPSPVWTTPALPRSTTCWPTWPLRKGCYYINIREALTNPADGSQIDDYATKDGVHFNAAGYPCLAEYLATHTVWNRRSVYSGENRTTSTGPEK